MNGWKHKGERSNPQDAEQPRTAAASFDLKTSMNEAQKMMRKGRTTGTLKDRVMNGLFRRLIYNAKYPITKNKYHVFRMCQ